MKYLILKARNNKEQRMGESILIKEDDKEKVLAYFPKYLTYDELLEIKDRLNNNEIRTRSKA